jgi:hypothetical protein
MVNKVQVSVVGLILLVSLIMVERSWGLPYDVNPPRCYFCCDVNFDGKVNVFDIFFVARCYGFTRNTPTWNSAADINRDGIVDVRDILLVINCFNKSSP